jgi:hypothetical protein
MARSVEKIADGFSPLQSIFTGLKQVAALFTKLTHLDVYEIETSARRDAANLPSAWVRFATPRARSHR